MTRSLLVCVPFGDGMGRQWCVFEAAEITVASVCAFLNLPEQASLRAGGRLYCARDELLPAHVERVDVHVGLCGGKGGFGALLRGGPGGLRTRKTTNFEACRDLSGRRLRHAQAEEKLKKWALKQTEVEKAKKAEAAAAKADKMMARQKVVSAFAEESQQLSDRTASALQRGLEARKKEQLRVATEGAKRELAAAQLKNSWDAVLDEDDEDDDEEDGEESKDYVISDVGRVTCDGCECVIVGERFHSVVREDYDLCAACRAKAEAGEGEYILVIQSLPPAEAEAVEGEEPVAKKRKEDES
jgi:hypothetical protein